MCQTVAKSSSWRDTRMLCAKSMPKLFSLTFVLSVVFQSVRSVDGLSSIVRFCDVRVCSAPSMFVHVFGRVSWKPLRQIAMQTNQITIVSAWPLQRVQRSACYTCMSTISVRLTGAISTTSGDTTEQQSPSVYSPQRCQLGHSAALKFCLRLATSRWNLLLLLLIMMIMMMMMMMMMMMLILFTPSFP